MSDKTSLLEIIKDSPLSDTTKDFFAKKVKREGATPENVNALRELLRAVQHQSFADAGLSTKDDATVKAAAVKLEEKLKLAGDEYAKTMARLEKETIRLASDIERDLQHLEKIVVQSATAEA